MGFTQAFKLALKSLAGSKLRAFLTMLGIIIGVGSVIILVSLMQGMTGEVTSMFEDMGTNMLTVNVTGRGSSRTVDVDDMYDLYEENTDVFMGMSPTVSIMGSVKTSTDSDSFSPPRSAACPSSMRRSTALRCKTAGLSAMQIWKRAARWQ